MSGEELVKQLQALGAPGAEELVGESYDWLFLNGEQNPLATFLHWFINNITSNNVLTDEELHQFELLQREGEVMSATQIQEMEKTLSSVPSLSGTSHQDLGELPPSPQELQALEDELESLTLKKNMLSAHKIDLHNEKHRLDSRLHRAQADLRREVEAASTTAFHFDAAQEKLGGLVDAHLNTYHKFDDATGENALFLSHMDFEQLNKEEDKFTHLLASYTEKQFKKGIEVLAGMEDSSEYVLMDINKLDMSLVQGAGEKQYRRNLTELRRLNALLPQTEEWRLRGLILQERRKAEVAEAERLLAELHQRHLPSEMTALRQQTEGVQASLSVVEKECRQQQQAIKVVLAEVARLESTKTISGDFELKLQRQGYFLNKQTIVIDQLVFQATRYNWLIIALQIERRRLSNMLHILKGVNNRMTDRDNAYTHRMVQLDAMVKKSEEDKASLSLPPALHTLSRLLPAHKHSKTKPADKTVLLKQLEELLSGLNTAQEHFTTLTSPQFSCISQMLSICDALEECLFGIAGSLQPLPLAWFETSLADRCHEAERKVREFKPKLIEVIAQYEKKKKILQIDAKQRLKEVDH